MDILGFVIGVLGFIVSAGALFYAWIAARRSDALLRRLVVYPFRELDIEFAKLTSAERRSLLTIYAGTDGGTRGIDSDLDRTLTSGNKDYGGDMLSFLEAERWLVKSDDGQFRINRDRRPYLTFLDETEMRGIER